MRTAAVFVLTVFSPLCLAHHGFAPHFDETRSVSITGKVTEYEARNPHAYVHLAVVDEDDRAREYVCESAGVSGLERNGLTRDIFAVGNEITLEGVPHRRAENMCFFRVVHLADGRVLHTDGSHRTEVVAETTTLPIRDSIFGTWSDPRGVGSAAEATDSMFDYLTAEGLRAVAEYDPFVDDPALLCIPVNLRRVMGGGPLNFTRDNEKILISREWMDARRTVHLDLEEPPSDYVPTSMGFSIGRFEGDTLVIETSHFPVGVLRQWVEEGAGPPTKGLLHSEEFRVVERISLDPEAQRLTVRMERSDRRYFSRGFEPIQFSFAPTDREVGIYGCVPDEVVH